MTYRVTIQRTEHREHTFEVTADSAAEANEAALEMVGDHDFGQNSVSSADEVVIATQPVLSETTLPDKLSDLLELALNDLDSVVTQFGEEVVDMTTWLQVNDRKRPCAVCLAGAMLYRRCPDLASLAEPASGSTAPMWDAVRPWHHKLTALDSARRGHVVTALSRLYGLSQDTMLDVVQALGDTDLFCVRRRRDYGSLGSLAHWELVDSGGTHVAYPALDKQAAKLQEIYRTEHSPLRNKLLRELVVILRDMNL